METKKGFKVQQCSAVKVVTKKFNHSVILIRLIKFPMRNLFFFMVVCFALFMTSMAHADLVNNGGGLIYDTDLNITWYDAPTVLSRNWWEQKDWAASLTIGNTTAGTWRLPSTVDGPIVYGYNGTTTGGWDITTSEMGHLYYTELGNKGIVSPDGSGPQPGYGLTNKGPFTNLQSDYYWSGTGYSLDVGHAWFFYFDEGYQGVFNKGKSNNLPALAVHEGNVVAPVLYDLVISKSGTGSGTVTSDPSGINCGNDCSENYSSGTSVALTATAGASSTFTGWSDGCSDNQTTCTITMNASKNVTAKFEESSKIIFLSQGWTFVSFPKLPASATVAIVFADVSSNIRIIWGYNNQTKEWLKYKPSTSSSTLISIEPGKGYWIYMNESGSINISNWLAASTLIRLYDGWNLIGYSGTDGVDVISVLSGMVSKWEIIWNWEDGAWKAKQQNTGLNLPVPILTNLNQGKAYWIKIKSGTGPFDYNAVAHYALTVTKSGAGNGTVTDAPLGVNINCGNDCTEAFAEGSQVSLTATPDASSTFAGWSGACIGTGTCSVTMDNNKTVTATFIPLTLNIGVLPASKDFGYVLPGTASTPQTFTISNTGTGSLNIGTINITSTNASEFILQNDNCTGKTIIPSGNCTLQVTFLPSTTGSKTATLSIPSNDPDTLNLNVSLSGTGENTTIRIYNIGDSVNYNLKATHIASGGQATGSLTYRIVQDETNPYGITCKAYEGTGTLTDPGGSAPISTKDLFYQDANGSIYDCGKYNSSTGSYVFIQNDQSTPNGLRLAIKSPLSVGNIQQATTYFEDGSWKTCTNKVEARENVTTPSGTFMAYKISSTCSFSDGTSQEGIEWYYPSIFYVKRIATSGGFEIRYDMTGYNMP